MESIKRYAPKQVQERLERHADLINMPRIGTADNYAYPTAQLNIAPAVAYEIATSAQFLCLDNTIKTYSICFTM
jgi:hypothetical protein